jgi:hypothetical protein
MQPMLTSHPPCREDSLRRRLERFHVGITARSSAGRLWAERPGDCPSRDREASSGWKGRSRFLLSLIGVEGAQPFDYK